MSFHAHLQCKRSRFNIALNKAITLLAVCLIVQSISTAQELKIRRENAFGGLTDEMPEHSIIINSRYQLVVFGMRDCDTCGFDEFRLNTFSPQLNLVGHAVVPLTSRWFKAGSFIESIGNGFGNGYAMIGSVSSTEITDPSFDSDIQVASITAGGVLLWEKRFVVPGNEEGVGIQQLNDGGYLIVANVNENNSLTQNTTGKSQIWLAKLDFNGNMVWNKLLTDQHNNKASDFKKAIDGHVILSGSTTDEVAFGDNGSRGDALLMKITPQGSIVWEKYIGGNADDEQFEKISLDDAGNIFAAGYSRSTNFSGQPARGGTDGWIARVSAGGVVTMSRLYGGSGDDHFNSIAIARAGFVAAGGSTLSRDGDVMGNTHGYTIWAMKMSNTNNTTHGFFGHSADDPAFIEDITLDPDYNVYCVATSGVGNVFIKNPRGNSDGWLFTLGDPNEVRATVYVDVNNNGRRDWDDVYFNEGKLEVTDGNTTEYFTSSKGPFISFVDTGTFTFKFIPDKPNYIVSPSAKTYSYNSSAGRLDSFAIRLTPRTLLPDLAVKITPLTIARPGFEADYMITVTNRGNEVANKPVITYIKDPRLTILTSNPAVTSVNGDTLVWDLASRSIRDTLHVFFTARIAAPPLTEIGDRLLSQASVKFDMKDETPFNDTFALTEIVGGSFDPNDKAELHGGVFPVDLLTTDKLHYLIRFQNTGTDTAFNIVIRDTLDHALDVSGFEMVAASHPYTMKIKDGRHVEWRFNNVLLPDSNRNEKASHGFLAFSIKPKASLKIDDVITNKASIYFDYNLPIVTNITSTRIVDLAALLPEPALSGLKTNYCGNESAQTITITNIVAAHPATITVKINGTAVNVDNSGKFLFEPAKLNAGNQNIEITFSNGSIKKKLALNFTITTPIKPVVKLNTNTTVVDKNTTILQLTATASAAGNAALYSFAKDRAMLNMLQPESSSNILALPAVSLNVGDNWIYVQMTSADDCVTSATAIDSVKIIRTAVTAIVDVDYPNTTITAYPMPFSSNLMIQGLQRASSYSIQLIDATGRIVVTQEVQNQTTCQFRNLNVRHGTYYIRLYDRKTKRLIGTMNVVKLK
ncbi:MAG: T9SS type A sorting domain-containing protein [Chitinophagaceae bacterium]|nr:MAG: T9SS type A sorting domain-containing protein [Chitinophagaceae bacterium]